MSDTRKFSVFGRMVARSGERALLVQHFEHVLKVGVPGLESCSINEVLGDPDAIWVTQVWTDRAAHDAGTRSDPLVSATERVRAVLAQPPEGEYGEVAYLHPALGD